MKTVLLFLTSLFFFVATARSQSRQITGKVVDDSANTAMGEVTITVKGSGQGTATDAQGNFSLTLPPGKAKADLTVSSIGYETISASAVPGKPLSIRLRREANALNEVVIIGYGTVKRRDVTGSITTIKTDEITRVPAQNPLQSIQGKIPGADINRSSGSATSGVSITIRGNRSIAGSNSPLFIVDGVQTGNIADINPNDIESIEFLKDASSTAIYGYQGANGIVIVTTKRGTSGKPKVSFNSYYGLSQISRYPQVDDGPAYVALKREAFRTTGKWNSVADDPAIFNTQELNAIRNNQWVDYQKLLLHNGSQQDYNIGVSAGSERTKIFFSLDYYNEKGLLKQDWLHRYSARFNVDQTIGSWIKAGLQSQVTYRDASLRRDPLNQANKISPLGTVYDSAGNFILYPLSGSAVNPLADEQPNVYASKAISTAAVVNAYVELKPAKGLTFRSNLGTSLGYNRYGLFSASTSIDRNGSAPLARDTTANNRFVNWDNIVTYSKQISDHSITVTGLTSYILSVSDYVSAQGQSQLIPAQLFYGLGNAPTNVAVNSGFTKYNTVSFAGRINYSYKGRYLVTLTDRADGASRLAAGHKWASFPSAAVAWRISDESFFKNVNFINDLKLRVSYGVAGNSGISPYGTQSSLSRVAFGYGDVSAQGFTFSPLAGNPDLGWELSATPNVGLDITLLQNRISATVDYYDTRTKDLLLPRRLPATTGRTLVNQNIGKTRNHGIEVALNTTNIKGKDVTWTSNITFTRNKEEIVALVNGVNDIATGLFINYPTSVFYDYQKLGIWQTKDAAEAAKWGQKPGDIRVQDLNNDGKIDATNDRMVVGTPRPKWFGGFNNSVSYKGFDLNVYIFARFGQTINPDFLRRYSTQATENTGTGIDYWTPEYPSNNYPRPNANLSLATMLYTSTIGYVDGSYVRLRNLSLGYSFPQVKGKVMSSLRLYLTGTNLLTWTKSDRLKSYDPERGGSENFPMTKVFTVGLNAGF